VGAGAGLATGLVTMELDSSTKAQHAKIIKSIKTSAMRLLNTINNTLDQASMRACGKLIIKKVPVNLKELCSQIMEIVRPPPAPSPTPNHRPPFANEVGCASQPSESVGTPMHAGVTVGRPGGGADRRYPGRPAVRHGG
jgi:signal transduction histidine kinase